MRGGIIENSPRFRLLFEDLIALSTQSRQSENTPLMTVLLEGSNGCGKSALAAKVALESNFPFVKLVSPESFVGYTEQGRVSQIVKIFEDAYKSPLLLIVLDDLERLIEFIHIGPRFSNHVRHCSS